MADWATRTTVGDDNPYYYEAGMDLVQSWLAFCGDLIVYPKTMIFGCRKFHSPVSWWVSGDVFRSPFLDYRQLGYGWTSTHGGRGKRNQMARNYYDEAQISGARDKIQQRLDLGRSQSSVSVRLQNHEKESRSQGFCMQSAIFAHVKNRYTDHFTVDVYYRITEVTQKFSADLLFLKDRIIPDVLGVHADKVSAVRFHFAQVYVSDVYMPILYSFAPPEEWLAEMKDEAFRDQLCRITENLFLKESKYTYRSRSIMHEVWKELGIRTPKTRPFITAWRKDKTARQQAIRDRRKR